jgi:hypothetical protein
MPFFYDLKRSFTTSGSANTEVSELWAKTITQQAGQLGIYAIYGSCRFATAGGAQLKYKTNTGTTASGGTAQTPTKKFDRNPAAESVWADGTTTITAGATLVVRLTVGLAQTGGMGGWQALTPQDAFQFQPNAASPVDGEFTTVAATASVTGDITVEIGEGL